MTQQQQKKSRQIREVRGSDVAPRLRELGPGLSVELFQELIKVTEQARSRRTRFHPVNAGGIAAYIDGTAFFRMSLFPSGWTPEDPRGAPAAVHPEGHLQIMIATGDEWTGLSELPTTQYPKGPTMERAVAANAQLSLPYTSASEAANPTSTKAAEFADGSRVTYYFLIRRDTVADKDGKSVVQIRAELSLPVEMVGGYPTDYLERIFFDPVTIESSETPTDFTEGDDIVVPVERR